MKEAVSFEAFALIAINTTLQYSWDPHPLLSCA